MKHLINLAFAIILTACAVSPQNPQQAIFQTKQNYELALTVAVAYDNLPTCGAGAPARACATGASRRGGRAGRCRRSRPVPLPASG